jgi:hypothetical protein
MSSKRRVGVLEAHEAPESAAPQTHCGAGIAEYLISKNYALKIGKRLIQMVKLTAERAIELAKAAREAAIKKWELQQLGIGFSNLIPFSRPTDPGQHFHYEIPHAGDVGIWRHQRKKIRVSARSRTSQPAPAIAATTTLAPSLADAFSA